MTDSSRAARLGKHVQDRILPDGAELQRRKEAGETFQQIADQYGVSRQAVHKALNKYKKDWEKQAPTTSAVPLASYAEAANNPG